MLIGQNLYIKNRYFPQRSYTIERVSKHGRKYVYTDKGRYNIETGLIDYKGQSMPDKIFFKSLSEMNAYYNRIYPDSMFKDFNWSLLSVEDKGMIKEIMSKYKC